MSTATNKIREIQIVLGVNADGMFGLKSKAALDDLIEEASIHQTPAASGEVHTVKASSFADPADVAAFRRCKAAGNSDQFCYSKGDNGEGTPALGDGGKPTDTTGTTPMCALPPEDWKPFGDAARGKKVLVKCGGREVICELRDTMPHKANIKNGAGIDLNAVAWKVLGHTPPVMLTATWQWV